jgi:ATP-dependent helicase Lhr and Lhr-like helicase
MSAFQQLCPALQQNLKEHRQWNSFRPVQELSYFPVSTGQNVLIFAPTAGGKTEAAMLPLLNRHFGGKEPGVKILYIAPLRALLNNLEKRFIETKLCEAAYFNVFKWHGDVSRSKKLKTVRELPDVLLTTPESLDVMLCSEFVNEAEFFAPLDAVVIDESHYFAGSDRGGQLVSALNRLEQILNRDLQRVCLSATVGNPNEVLDWLTLPSKRKKVVVQPPAEPMGQVIELNYYDSDDPNAIEALTTAVVHASLGKKSIIFEPSRKAAEERSKDFPGQFALCHVHHGSVDKFWRERAEMDLAEASKAATVIATCTLELGLDVGDLDLIQQEGDFPSVSSFVQRIGRTGRRRPPQCCFAHVTDEFEFLKNLAVITLAETGFVESNSLPTNSYHLLLQQLLMEVLGSHGFPVAEARSKIRQCAALHGILDADFDILMNFWLANDVLRLSNDLLLVGMKVERAYSQTHYRDLYVLFDSPQIFEVWHGRMPIGTLDLFFVHAKRDQFVFILAGKWWQVEEVRYKESVVMVKPFSSAPPAATWIAPRGHEVSYPLAQQIKRLLLENKQYPSLKQSSSRELLARLRQRAHDQGLENISLQIHSLPKRRYEIVTYAGDRVNLLLASLLTKLCGWDCKDITYASFRTEKQTDSAEDFSEIMRQLLERIMSERLLADETLLAELAAPFDDAGASKWSGWLPAKYRERFLSDQIFDRASTIAWIRSSID